MPIIKILVLTLRKSNWSYHESEECHTPVVPVDGTIQESKDEYWVCTLPEDLWATKRRLYWRVNEDFQKQEQELQTSLARFRTSEFMRYRNVSEPLKRIVPHA